VRPSAPSPSEMERGRGGEATPSRGGVARALRDHWPTPVALILVAVVWEAWVRWTHTPAYLVPAPSAILGRAVGGWQYFLGEATVTLAEAFAGLLVASAGALSAALVMAHARWAERAFFPLAVVVKVTPIVAIAPLLIVWLGFGPAPKIAVAALISFFPILSNAVTGFRSVNPRALEFFHSLHASRREILLELRLPHALPYLFSAYKVAMTLSVIGAVVAEWFGADHGLGHVIILANANFDMTTLAAAVLALAIIGISLYAITDALERRCLFWHESNLSTQVDR